MPLVTNKEKFLQMALMSNIQLILIVHDLRIEIILEYRNAKSNSIPHLHFYECGSYLSIHVDVA
jgi:hypothetical protein